MRWALLLAVVVGLAAQTQPSSRPIRPITINDLFHKIPREYRGDLKEAQRQKLQEWFNAQRGTEIADIIIISETPQQSGKAIETSARFGNSYLTLVFRKSEEGSLSKVVAGNRVRFQGTLKECTVYSAKWMMTIDDARVVH